MMFHYTTKVVLICCFVCLLFPWCSAWGPVTHQYFTCSILGLNATCIPDTHAVSQDDTITTRKHDNTSPLSSLSPSDLASYALGGSSPDAYKDLGLHDLVFAGYMLQYASSIVQGHTPVEEIALSPTFSPLSFASGYGAHLVEDAVGHFSPGGYLNPAYDHYQELAVDAYNVEAFKNASASRGIPYPIQLFSAFDPPSKLDTSSNPVASFVSAAYVNYTASTGGDPNVNLTAIQNAQDKFDTLLLVEMLALPAEELIYQPQLIKYDIDTNTTTYSMAAQHIATSFQCCVTAVRYWLDQFNTNMRSNGSSSSSNSSSRQVANLPLPIVAANRTTAYVASMMADGSCSPALRTRIHINVVA